MDFKGFRKSHGSDNGKNTAVNDKQNHGIIFDCFSFRVVVTFLLTYHRGLQGHHHYLFHVISNAVLFSDSLREEKDSLNSSLPTLSFVLCLSCEWQGQDGASVVCNKCCCAEPTGKPYSPLPAITL